MAFVLGLIIVLIVAIAVLALAYESYREGMENVAKGNVELGLAKNSKTLAEQIDHIDRAYEGFKVK